MGIDNLPARKILSPIQSVYRHLQRAIPILSFKKGMNVIAELTLPIIRLQKALRTTVI